ncbi:MULTISPECIES: DUF192 domain-containing protein [Streptomyces]|uniref:DUF192 domain-containing protein n=2 Tax=Streptomyces TaxID=1883 RepID=A0A100Y7V6_9ACTN|nr:MULTISPECIES: DUF192 domain-containing protein [Streptomyces]KUH39301.1 hypothetical protein ATE80_08485 [Streptomyces kanasensis]UUS32738.1 DUF192 domain-containing protein [Streptomyces changanensis]
MAKWRDGTGILRVVEGGSAGSGGGNRDGDGDAGVPVEVAATYRARARGLLGRDGIDGAMLLTPCGSVHTFRMRFAIDVAYLRRDLTVLAVVPGMRPGRLGLPRMRARHVLEAEAGAMERWGVRPGVRLAVDPSGQGGPGPSSANAP